MSLVGPRPHAIEHNEYYRNMITGYMQRHSKLPGMTGLAQIEGAKGETNTIEKTIDRKKIWLAQTPQVFDKAKLKRAISNSKISNIKATDESYLMEKMGYKINIVEGSAINLKITFKSDWSFAEHLEKNFNEHRI